MARKKFFSHLILFTYIYMIGFCNVNCKIKNSLQIVHIYVTISLLGNFPHLSIVQKMRFELWHIF